MNCSKSDTSFENDALEGKVRPEKCIRQEGRDRLEEKITRKDGREN